MTDHIRQNLKKLTHSGEFIVDSLPTVTIKKAQIQATIDTGSLRASVTPTTGKVGLLTYLHLGANLADIEYSLADRSGTFDIVRVGTAAGIANHKTDFYQQGNFEQPIHVVNGSLNIYHSANSGSQSAGSFTVAFEVIQL